MTGKPTLPKEPQGAPPLEIRADEVLRPKGGDPLAVVTGSQVPAFNNTLLNSLISAAWFFKADDKEARSKRATAAFAAMHAYAPKNEIEGMMAAQAVALHMAAMECARRAMISDQPGEAAAKLRRDAASLSRAMVDMTEAIERRRGKAPQVVRVERVVVQDGGQAIVGNITSEGHAKPVGGGQQNGTGEGPHATRALEERQPTGRPLESAPLRRAHADRAPVPRTGDG